MNKYSFSNGLVMAFIAYFSFGDLNQAFAQQNSNNDRSSSSPVVTIGGFVNATAGSRTQEDAFGDDRLLDAKKGVANTGTHNRMTNNPDFTNEAEIHVKVAGINEFGMKYGAIVELQANTSPAARNEGVSADKVYIFTESRMGKVELGNNSAVNQKMKVGPETFARGAGGINGKYLEYINLPMLADSSQVNTAIGGCSGGIPTDGSVAPDGDCANIKLPSFILIPGSPIVHGGYARSAYDSSDYIDGDFSRYSDSNGPNSGANDNNYRDGQFGDLADASKINYYTPRISGWQLGLTLTPDTGAGGTSATISGDNSGDIKQAISYGLNYSSNVGNLGFAVSATGENGSYEGNSSGVKRNKLQAYEAGFMATYLGFTVGASYGNWGDSLQPSTGIYSCNYDSSENLIDQNCSSSDSEEFSDATYYTAGLAYQFGPFGSSVTYLESNFQENQYEALSFGIDYRMAKGLMPYAEVTKYEFQSNRPEAKNINSTNQLKDNKGYVALVGLLFSF